MISRVGQVWAYVSVDNPGASRLPVWLIVSSRREIGLALTCHEMVDLTSPRYPSRQTWTEAEWYRFDENGNLERLS